MGKVIMSCGHEAVGEEWKRGWWWHENGKIVEGNLCKECARVLGAIPIEDGSGKERRPELQA